LGIGDWKVILLQQGQAGRTVTFRSAKVAVNPRYFCGAKGDKRLPATATKLGVRVQYDQIIEVLI
jgi:hypothetical protein